MSCPEADELRPSDGATRDERREPRGPQELLVVSEYPLLVASVRAAIVGSEFSIAGTAKSGAEALPLVAAHPHAVLLLATRDPAAVLALVREHHPDATSIVFDDSATPETARAALSHGARGFVASTIEPSGLVPALRQILEDTSFRVVGVGLTHVGLEPGELTERERQMLAAVAEGLSNLTIARRFEVAEPTVKLHLTRIYRKLGVRNRTEAARWLFEHGYPTGTRESR